jgi:hypothetical protein
MVVCWCKSCRALLGLRAPFFDWSEVCDDLCPLCAIQDAPPRCAEVVKDNEGEAAEPPAPAG